MSCFSAPVFSARAAAADSASALRSSFVPVTRASLRDAPGGPYAKEHQEPDGGEQNRDDQYRRHHQGVYPALTAFQVHPPAHEQVERDDVHTPGWPRRRRPSPPATRAATARSPAAAGRPAGGPPRPGTAPRPGPPPTAS